MNVTASALNIHQIVHDIALTALDRVSLWEWGVTAEPYGKVIRHPWRTVTYTHRVVVVAIR